MSEIKLGRHILSTGKLIECKVDKAQINKNQSNRDNIHLDGTEKLLHRASITSSSSTKIEKIKQEIDQGEYYLDTGGLAEQILFELYIEDSVNE